MSAPEKPPLRLFRPPGLSGKLMILTLAFVMLAEVLIFVPSIANFRNNWLQDRLAAAQVAALVLEAAPTGMVPETLTSQLLENVGAVSIALRTQDTRRLLAVGDVQPAIAHSYDLRTGSFWESVTNALHVLFEGGPDFILVTSGAARGDGAVEMVISERPLYDAMIKYGINVLLLSLIISSITAALVYAALHRMIVRPVKRLAESANAFAEDAENAQTFVRPSGRRDEIGEAERQVHHMQTALSQQLRQQQHLASLGLAVAKINHDLRNMLASAHLLSDRLASLDDPGVQRIAPKLIGALDRAVGFCQATLAYGKAQERAPAPRKFDLWTVGEDLRDLLALGDSTDIVFALRMPRPMVMTADPDQILRILMNLARNSLEAMAADGRPATGPRELVIEARRQGERIEVDVIDNGPGIPPGGEAKLFQAFSGSARIGGTGLGLVIAAELARAHGGTLALVKSSGRGACFRLALPA